MLPWHRIKAREEIDILRCSPGLAHAEAAWPAALGTIYSCPPPYSLAGLLPKWWPTAGTPYVGLYCFPPRGLARADSLWNNRLLSCPFAHDSGKLPVIHPPELDFPLPGHRRASLTVPESNGPRWRTISNESSSYISPPGTGPASLCCSLLYLMPILSSHKSRDPVPKMTVKSSLCYGILSKAFRKSFSPLPPPFSSPCCIYWKCSKRKGKEGSICI